MGDVEHLASEVDRLAGVVRELTNLVTRMYLERDDVAISPDRSYGGITEWEPVFAGKALATCYSLSEALEALKNEQAVQHMLEMDFLNRRAAP